MEFEDSFFSCRFLGSKDIIRRCVRLLTSLSFKSGHQHRRLVFFPRPVFCGSEPHFPQQNLEQNPNEITGKEFLVF